MNIFSVISLFGGLALFLYGMRVMGDGLKSNATGVLKPAIDRFTGTKIGSFLTGLGFTALIQSSTATIVLTSGLVGAEIITLRRSIGIILGANVGTRSSGCSTWTPTRTLSSTSSSPRLWPLSQP